MTSNALKKFLNPHDIEIGIAESVLAAKQQEIQIALAGGIAMQLMGSDRLTTDVDFIADGTPNTFNIRKLLSFGGAAMTSPSGVPVDFIVRDDDYAALYEAALDTASLEPDLGVRVALPEYMIAMKLSAGRAKDEQDIMKVLNEGTLDLVRVRAVLKEYLGIYAVHSFNSFVDEAAWQRSKEKAE